MCFHRFFGAHNRIELDASGSERLVGFNFAEEPTGALVNFFEYDPGFRLVHKATHRLEVAPRGIGWRAVCLPHVMRGLVMIEVGQGSWWSALLSLVCML